MKDTHYIWTFPEPDPGLVSELSRSIDISPHLARVLVNRGIHDPDNALAYLEPTPALIHNPFLMKEMRQAVDRANKALENGDRILVLGDYDVDGISGTAVLVSFLRELGGNVNYYIPDRETEGYGLSEDVVRKSHKAGYGLIVTVDSGVSAVHEAGVAAELGLDMIIIDHHEPPPTLPRAAALLNPKREDSTYPFRELAGVGVAFKFLCALASTHGYTLDAMLERFAELVTLGTIGDLVPLLDENRALVRIGLDRMQNTGNLGLHYLIDVSRYNDGDKPDNVPGQLRPGPAHQRRGPRVETPAPAWNCCLPTHRTAPTRLHASSIFTTARASAKRPRSSKTPKACSAGPTSWTGTRPSSCSANPGTSASWASWHRACWSATTGPLSS